MALLQREEESKNVSQIVHWLEEAFIFFPGARRIYETTMFDGLFCCPRRSLYDGAYYPAKFDPCEKDILKRPINALQQPWPLARTSYSCNKAF